MKSALWSLLVLLSPGASGAAIGDALPPQPQILHTVQLVNDRWMQSHPDPGGNDWDRATYFTGAMRAWEALRDPAVLDYVYAWGKTNDWTVPVHDPPTYANVQCCGQTYLDVFRHEGCTDVTKIVSISNNVQIQVERPWVDDWSWIDALYMSAPVFARLGHVFGRTNYWMKMHALYHHTGYERSTDVEGVYGLYDAASGLWYRDGRYVYPNWQTAGGEKVFWARGNGWVLGALVRILDELPPDEPHRAEYEAMIQTMASTLATNQNTNGFWGASILDIAEKPEPETSGTAFFTYGMAWGINRGLLDRATYEPIVARAWNGMVAEAVHTNGFLGWVQPEDRDPYNTWTYDTTRDYGVGAFLLAGIEVARLQGPIVILEANAGGDQTRVDADNNGFEWVLLDGSGSAAYGDTIASYTWYVDGACAANTVSNRVTMGLGTHPVRLVITGTCGGSATSTAHVAIAPGAPLLHVAASDFQDEPDEYHPPSHTVDGDFSTRWSACGDPQWIQYELHGTQQVQSVDIAFFRGTERFAFFDIELSFDGANWTNVYPDGKSSQQGGLEPFVFDDRNAHFVRITGHGNSVNEWNSYNEVVIHTDGAIVPDADGDGMNDWWEADHLGTLALDGTADSDEDGMRDADEYVAGTHPKIAADVLTITLEDGMLRFESRCLPGQYGPGLTRFYAVEQTVTLTGTWSLLPGYERIECGGTIFVPVDTEGAPQRFFRITTWLE